MKQVHQTRSDQLTSFRLPKTLLRTVDSLCEEQDVTRSQFFRRCIVAYISDHDPASTELAERNKRIQEGLLDPG